jgi:hypothetical protein
MKRVAGCGLNYVRETCGKKGDDLHNSNYIIVGYSGRY